MINPILSGAAAAALLATSAAAAPVRGEASAWVVTPAADSCRTELELTGAAGASASVVLVSDGDGVDLVFAKPNAPERAFLPIRIDHKPFANLVLRQAGGRTATMRLSPETLTALRKGGALQVSWLADEVVQAPLTGSEQGLADLRTCGAQVAQRFRDQQAAQRDAQARAEAETRARAIADEQLAAAKAQKQAAEAEGRRAAAEAERLRADADAARQRAAVEQAQAARDQAQTDPYRWPSPAGYPPPSERDYPRPYPSYGGPDDSRW